jgi:demethylmenaquinone methyltransferase/2-methoxy-6-polyprenyl-1,4-benzoquinol methylase
MSEALPFSSGSIQCIIMVDAFHHVYNQNQTVRELWRVLKPGGKIVIEEPDIRNFSVKLVALAEKAVFMRSHFLSPPHIASLFSIHEGANVRVEREGISGWVVVKKTGDKIV